MKGRIISLVYPCLAEIFNQYFSRKVLSYLNGICPTKKMSCIGKYRRNLIFLEETSRYLSYWAGYAILDGSITMVAMTSKLASPTLLFWIHNILAFAFIDVFYGLYVPLNMKLPSEKVLYHGPRFQLITASKDLEPRRYLEVGWREETGSVEPSTPPTSPLTLPSKFTTVSGLTVWQVIKFENATSIIIDTIFNNPSGLFHFIILILMFQEEYQMVNIEEELKPRRRRVTKYSSCSSELSRLTNLERNIFCRLNQVTTSYAQ